MKAATTARKAATEATEAVNTLAALAQETRLSIFRLLIEHAPHGLTPGAIGTRLDLAPATLSFHLKELGRAGLVDDRRESRFIWYSANLDRMRSLVDYLTRNCCKAAGGCCTRASAAWATKRRAR
ncbi:MAG TPA: metalloregulator ArsR/SmtB family transcription factor [Casimicrobiaceae bacterium]|nr:metalloregulator ArsR/SmtB family transcription factor [Casimicrobiaceae bacterium]